MDGHLLNSLELPAPQAEALAVSFELVKDHSKAVRDALVPAVVDSLSLEQLRSLWKAVVDTTQVMHSVQTSLFRAFSELQDRARLRALFDSLNKKLATWNADMLHQESDEHACVLLPEERFWAKYLVVPEYLDRMSVVGTVGGDAYKCSVYRATHRIVDVGWVSLPITMRRYMNYIGPLQVVDVFYDTEDGDGNDGDGTIRFATASLYEGRPAAHLYNVLCREMAKDIFSAPAFYKTPGDARQWYQRNVPCVLLVPTAAHKQELKEQAKRLSVARMAWMLAVARSMFQVFLRKTPGKFVRVHE
jgi:hypothetical protein